MINTSKKAFMTALLGIAMVSSPLLWQPAHAAAPQQAPSAKATQAAAQAGDAAAQLRLAIMYFTGEGMPKDVVSARLWAEKAAEQDVVGAQRLMAVIYAQGHGVKQDPIEAAEWWEKAAEQGDAHAQYTLGLYYATGNGVNQDFGDAAKWFAQAAAQGHGNALGQLGYLFSTGQGVKGSRVIAFALMTLSVANDMSDDNKAVSNRTALMKRMSSEELEAGKKLSYAMIEPGNFTKALTKAYAEL